MLKYVFAVQLGWLPPSGRQSVGINATHITNMYVLDGLLTREWDAAWDALKHLVLPSLALATIPFAVVFRITRASVLDLVAPLVAIPGLVAAGVAAGDPAWLSVARVLVGAAFLGAISDGMLLGHWYLVQPGLARRPLLEMVRWTGWVWPAEVALLLVPTGMASVLSGSIDDGYNGMLGWFWVACAVTTIGLVVVTRAALKERYYSAVMAATGLLYLAILTAFGTDLVARALLADPA